MPWARVPRQQARPELEGGPEAAAGDSLGADGAPSGHAFASGCFPELDSVA